MKEVRRQAKDKKDNALSFEGKVQVRLLREALCQWSTKKQGK